MEIVSPEEVFDGDVFLFCASRFVPDTSVTSGDVRMAQYQVNRELAVRYARMARQRRYGGMFCVVSDPVDPLCRAVLEESNRDETGRWDGGGLFSHQVRGFGLGVMQARAMYYARKEPRFAAFLTEGRTYGPHGADLVAANSIEHYDDALSRELTERVVQANLEMRRLGFKPYVAPALSSGALSLLACLRGAVALLVHLSGWGVYGGQKPAAPHGDGAGAAAPAGGLAGAFERYHGAPAGDPMKRRERGWH